MVVVAGRWRSGCLLAMVVAVVGACTSDSSAPVDPDASPMYEVSSDDLCTQATADTIGAQLGLVDMTHAGGDPVEDGESWRTDCVIIGLWRDERFLTELGPAGPTATVTLEVYADVEAAVRRYESSRDVRQGLVPQSPMREVDGWWDEGWRIRWYEPLDGASTNHEGLDAVVVLVRGSIRHHNLVIFVGMRGTVPGPMREEGYEVLSNLGDLLIEEARQHVTLSTGA